MAKDFVKEINELAVKIDRLVAAASDEELDSPYLPPWVVDSIITLERSQRDYDRSD